MVAELHRFILESGIVIALVVAVACLRPTWVVRFPKSILAVVAIISLGAALAVFKPVWPFFRIELDPSSEPLLPVEDPGRDVYR